MRRAIDLQGHRGARGLFPENTLAGFSAALAIGVDSFELAVAVTADGVPVVSHDPALNPDLVRGPDGAWLTVRGPLIRTLRLSELAAYDVGRIRPGSAYASQFPDQAPCDGARIPTLAEVLGAEVLGAEVLGAEVPGAEALAVAPAVRFNLEMKTFPAHPDWTVSATAMAEAVIAVAEAAGAIGRITVESFDWRGPRQVRRLRPDLPLAWLTSPESVAEAALWWDGPVPADYAGSVPRAVAAEGGPIWAPHHAELTGELIDEAHTLGLAVLAWTVNHAASMRRLLRAGIDGLITDRPDIARKVLAEEGFPPPSAR
jgi:glycerophosphoryl diester phosphodiesterase